MSIINSQPRIGAAGQSTGPFKIERSLRFNSADSARLTRTFASAGNRKTWTISAWVKCGVLGTNRSLFGAEVDGSNSINFRFDSDNNLDIYNIGSGSVNARLITTQVFRDVSAWYHIVFVWDTTQASGTNRMRLYVNGSEVTTFNTDTNPTQNLDGSWNTTSQHEVGAFGGTAYFNGYMTEVNFIDGQALTPSSFGETDTDTGVWKPKAYSGSYGTNGFYLKFADNSGTTSTTLGKDSSGNGNNWTPNNFSVTAGAGNDSLVDTPTPYGTDTGAGGEVRGNYCTANPLDIYPKSGTWTVSNGNLDLSLSGAVWDAIRGTTGVTSGKWYWEITATGIDNTNSYAMVGIQKGAGGNWQDPFAYVYYSLNGQKYNNGSGAAYGNSWTTNDVIGVAFDADAGEIKFYKNNTVQNSGTAAYTGLTSGPYTPVIMLNGTGSAATVTCNFGQRPFAYTAPSGFKALCTQNLPTPTIGATATTRADDYFNTVLYTGNGSTQSITGVGFQPDFTWIKSRSGVGDNNLTDAVRGATITLFSNDTSRELTLSNGLTSFNSDGFSVGSNSGFNTNTTTYVAWNWNAGGSNATNTSGSITSTVRANTTAGFSIVTFTTPSSFTNATVGHGLGATPAMIITKYRPGIGNWETWHTSLTSTQYLRLNTTAAAVTDSTVFNGRSSTTFTLGSSTWWGGGDFLAYCFSEVAGYSKFGSYTGNGSTDGPFVFTGFRPRYVMVKKSSDVGNWVIKDTARDTYNQVIKELSANTSSAEDQVNDEMDYLSNGFKLRSLQGVVNTNGATYIYAAFAEVPTKFALAR